MTIVESKGKKNTVVSYLELKKQIIQSCKLNTDLDNISVVRLEDIDVEYYRFLYDRVGKEWGWTERKLLNDNDLNIIINSSSTEILVLYVNGIPNGYLEISFNVEESPEIVFFGIIRRSFGKGLGSYLLSHGIDFVWSRPRTSRLWLHTCDLDHENALPTYYKFGFEKYDEKIEEVDII